MVTDYIGQVLEFLNSIPSPFIGFIMVAFAIGYILGGVFTADTWGGRFVRGFVIFVLASSGFLDFLIAQKGLPLFGFIAGFAFNMRDYINAFLHWTADILTAIVKLIYAFFDAILKAMFYFGRSLHVIALFFDRFRVPFAEAQAQAEAKPEEATKRSEPPPDVEAERRKREEEMHAYRRAQGQTKDRASGRAEGSDKQEQPQHQSPPPPQEPPDPTKSVDAALRFFGLDKHLFTYEDLRQAHRKKARNLHPDNYGQLPPHIQSQLDDEMKKVNAARDLIKKSRDWV